ncbi:HCL414Cp [Eremothecium sinecaudum]|uniref:HCL414Cp n=1 Tax=Eremothecium sinecaudum TaxID=45286 RepID=A0A109UYN0_9SACH|nr:HCL414Cp [Eremothecium sinecaudum]AMD19737.1 HCL414Cp [Eremothecium sinecaudum]
MRGEHYQPEYKMESSLSKVDRAILRRYYVFIYPIILLCGMTVRFVLGKERLAYEMNHWYLIKSDNIFNVVFADNGNKIWMTLICFLAFQQFSIRNQAAFRLPLSSRNIGANEAYNYRSALQLGLQYTFKFTMVKFLLFIEFWFIDHVFMWTGGYCSIDNIKNAMECHGKGGKWEGGFDISGHFCYLMTCSLALWFELTDLIKYTVTNEIPQAKLMKVTKYSTLTVLVMWLLLLSVTSIYYHTLIEKVLGVLMGYLCPFILYIYIPYHYKLQKILY